MEKLFLSIVNMSVSACFMVLAVLFVRIVFKKVPGFAKCMLWGLVGLRLILPFGAQSVMSLIPSAQTFPIDAIESSTPVIHSGLTHLNMYVNPILEESFSKTGAPTPLSIVNIASVIWLIGFALMLIVCAFTYIKLKYKLMDSIKMEDGVYRTDKIASPFVLGLIRPKIYMPLFMEDNAAALCLAHEKAHIRRKDHIIKPIAYLVLSIHWFNPFVWAAYVMLCRDIEIACDEKVIRHLGKEGRAEYSRLIVSSGEKKLNIAACPFAFGESSLGRRVKNVLSYRKPTFWIIIAASLVCCVIGVCFLTYPHTLPSDDTLLNYFVFADEIAKQDIIQAIYCPKSEMTTSFINVGRVQGPAVKSFLYQMEWYEIEKPKNKLYSPESVEFILDDDTRLQLYSKRIAVIKNGDEVRYYRIKRSDYEYGVNIVKVGSMAAKGIFEVEDCVYMSLFSSTIASPPYKEYYLINGDSFIRVSEETGETYSFNNIVWNWQKSSKRELEALIEPISKMNFDNFDMDGVLKQRISQNKYLYKVGEKFWLASTYETPNGDVYAMSIYSLKPNDDGLRLMTWNDLLRIIEDRSIKWFELGMYSRKDVGSGMYVYSFEISENWFLLVSSSTTADFANESIIVDTANIFLKNRDTGEAIMMNEITDELTERIKMLAE